MCFPTDSCHQHRCIDAISLNQQQPAMVTDSCKRCRPGAPANGPKCGGGLAQILSVYMSGSKNMAYDSANLTTPDIKWLGVRPSDLNRRAAPNLIPANTPESRDPRPADTPARAQTVRVLPSAS